MSYTSSDPENLNRDLDSNSSTSASTTSGQPSKGKKKPWSKFKSSFKSIGDKMSSKPKFPEQAEGGEQRRSKKNKKSKAGGNSEEVNASPPEEKKEKTPPTAKGLLKKLSAESLATPYVGYQPKSVTPTMSYAKALHKSGSTSESNLSTSDMDSPRKVSTSDKNTKYSLITQESPDSGRVSQEVEGRDVSSDFSGGSDYNLGPHKASVDNLEAPGLKNVKTKDIDDSIEFIKAETTVATPNVPMVTSSLEPPKPLEPVDTAITKTQERDDKNENNESETKKKDDPLKGLDKVEGHRMQKDLVISNIKENTSSDFIKSEQSKSKNENIDRPSKDETEPPSNAQLQISEVSQKIDLDSVKDKDNVINKVPKEDETKDTQSIKAEDNIKEDISPNPLKEVTGAGATENNELIPSKLSTESEGNLNNDLKTEARIEEGDKTTDKKGTPTNISLKDELQLSKILDTPGETQVSEDPAETPSKASEDAVQDFKISVEEKLAAFLCSDVWSGTIKDVHVRSGDDGSQQPDKRECLYKILVIGELGTGKTSIIKRYVHQFFSQHYRATIGVDFALKVLNWDPNTIIRLQLWDIAGQERFGNMTRVYYKEAVGAFIVFDVTRSSTFDAVMKWKNDLDSKVQLADGSAIPCILLANKCDQQKEGIVNTPSKMEEYCKENNFSAWFETSAKENINIDEAAKSLVTQILQNDKMSQNGRDSARDGGKFPLDGKSEQEGKTCSC